MIDRRARFRRFGRRRAGLAAGAAAACALALAAWLYPEAFAGVYRQSRVVIEASAAIRGTARDISEFVLTHPHFTVREVKVLGAQRVKGEDIVVMTGLGPHTGIWSTDPVELGRKVERHPWVKRALVRRELPARLTITVEEWSPGGIVALDRLYYVADDGVIFKALDEEDSVDLPFVTGLRAAGLVPEAPDTRKKLSQVLELAHTVERAGLDLSEIRFRSGGGVVLYPVSYAVPFHMGWGDWDDKLRRLQWFLREFREQGARFRAVDLSFKGQVVARPRKRA
ncbi:MAG: FtsQ-type POTRA domain-containing protein [Deltaproteobacteria bacterium]|nr:FtsQ-type POTRA domain-containing protein [Deltaproteobacteria bacterium]